MKRRIFCLSSLTALLPFQLARGKQKKESASETEEKYKVVWINQKDKIPEPNASSGHPDISRQVLIQFMKEDQVWEGFARLHFSNFWTPEYWFNDVHGAEDRVEMDSVVRWAELPKRRDMIVVKKLYEGREVPDWARV